MIALIVVGLLVGHTHGSVSTNKYSPLGPASSMEKDSKSGCAACTVIISVLEDLAEVHNNSVSKELAQVCDLFPKGGTIRDACQALVKYFGPLIIKNLEAHNSPDVVCRSIGLCHNPLCKLKPHAVPAMGLEVAAVKIRTETIRAGLLHKDVVAILSGSSAAGTEDGTAPSASPPAPPLPPGLPAICKLKGLEKLCADIFGFGNNHLPIEDADKDGFSGSTATLRGTDWRGKDCGTDDAAVHPGAKPIDSDRDSDSNCNGISGVNPKTGRAYEDELCAGTPRAGVVVLGDSASAHFHIPQEYLNATAIDNSTFAHIDAILEDEFDWPMLSAMTAKFATTDSFPNIDGPVNSTYLVNSARNLCSKNDYQNLGVNGARAGPMNDTIQDGMSREQDSDEPAIVMYALIGNDVCNGHANDTVAHMTTPDAMKLYATATMDKLDKRLPKGSHVVMMGLADGRVLYESLASRVHPLGALHHDITFADVYAYLNCLEISPCSGWMNANATLRNATTQRAVELSAVLSELATSYPAQNFDLHYMENPLVSLITKWVAGGGEVWELIEPVDGFHPNQYAQALIGGAVVDFLEAGRMLPPINPNNAAIEQIFGDVSL